MERTSLKLSKDGVTEVPLIYTKRLTCRACHDYALEPVLDLGNQYLPRFTKNPDLSLPKAPLELVRCGHCGLLQLQHSVDRDLLFRDYWYRSSINDTMKSQLRDLVQHAYNWHKTGRWLDIGANDGYLLSQVPPCFHKTACEPAKDFHEGLRSVADTIVPTYFTADVVHGPFEVITSAAMFYDLDDPGRFARDIAKCLTDDGIWINQLNDAPTMLQKTSFDSICHEHVAYYDVPTLERIYGQSGLTITRVTFNDVNGGSIRVVARKSTRQREDLLGIPATHPTEVRGFAQRSAKWKQRMGDLCEGPFALGGCYLYGASTKAMVMLQYLSDTSCFTAAAERNPRKLGLKMSGSWLNIVSEDDMRNDKPRWIVVGPWGLGRDEFLKRERETLRSGATLVFPLPSIEFVL